MCHVKTSAAESPKRLENACTLIDGSAWLHYEPCGQAKGEHSVHRLRCGHMVCCRPHLCLFRHRKVLRFGSDDSAILLIISIPLFALCTHHDTHPQDTFQDSFESAFQETRTYPASVKMHDNMLYLRGGGKYNELYEGLEQDLGATEVMTLDARKRSTYRDSKCISRFGKNIWEAATIFDGVQLFEKKRSTLSYEEKIKEDLEAKRRNAAHRLSETPIEERQKIVNQIEV